MKTFSQFLELIEQKVPNFRGPGGNLLRMVTTNPATHMAAQNLLSKAAATNTLMNRTLPGMVVAGSLAGIDLLRQKREKEKSDAETRRVGRIASNYGPGGPQRLIQGPKNRKPMEEDAKGYIPRDLKRRSEELRRQGINPDNPSRMNTNLQFKDPLQKLPNVERKIRQFVPDEDLPPTINPPPRGIPSTRRELRNILPGGKLI